MQARAVDVTNINSTQRRSKYGRSMRVGGLSDRSRLASMPADPDPRLYTTLNAAAAGVSVGVRELCCRLGVSGRSFARTAENLKSAAQISVSAEMLRGIVEAEGKAVLAVSADEQLELDWSAKECVTTAPAGQQVSRMYVSADGVLVATTTAVEKQKRRSTVSRRGRRCPSSSSKNSSR